jgi:hypothetical protein
MDNFHQLQWGKNLPLYCFAVSQEAVDKIAQFWHMLVQLQLSRFAIKTDLDEADLIYYFNSRLPNIRRKFSLTLTNNTRILH